MPDKIHLTVATVIEDQGRYLMVKETDKVSGAKVYNQPAGHVEPGETLIRAAHRETLEETGWHIELTGVLGLTTFTAPSNGVTYYRVVFAARPLKQISQQLDDDIDEVVWLDDNMIVELQEQFRSPLVMMAIEDYRSGIQYPLDMIREQS